MRPPFVTVREEDEESISALLQSTLALGKCNHVVLHFIVGNMCCSYPKAMVGAAVSNPLRNLKIGKRKKYCFSILIRAL